MTALEKVGAFVAVVGIVAVLCCAVALLIGVVHAGVNIVTTGLLFALQVIVLVLAVIAAIAVAALIFFGTKHFITKQLAELDQRYAKELARLRKTRPTWVAIFVLATEAALLVAEHALDEHKREALVASVALLIGFWVANQMMTCEEPWKRIFGLILWFAVLGIIPGVLIHDVGFARFIDDLNHFPASSKLVSIVAILAMAGAPFLAHGFGAETAG